MRGIMILGRFISFYGPMILIGITAAVVLAHFQAKRFGLDTDYLIVLEAYAVGGGMLGAKLLSIFQIWNLIDWSRMLEPNYFLAVIRGGYVFYGGLLGGLAALFLGGLLHRIRVLDYIEAAVPCLPLAHGFGRIGCHLASCCYGIPYNGIGHVIYHDPSFAPAETPLFPVQLLEACVNFLLALVLFLFVRRKKLTCWSVSLYLTAYAVIRFLLEFLRYDAAERGIIGPFSTSQWISLAILPLTALFTFVMHRRESRQMPQPLC